ncbi:MAG: MFS transporter [Candidatus Lokiarchaeota archaeon]|nr:MFS transporter [Candidatus Lokiarchaeota archaeon]
MYEGRYCIEKDLITTLNLSAVTFLVLLGLSIVAPILPYYAETFNVNYTLVGLVVSAFGIARMFIDLPAGLMGQKYNKKILMLLGLTLVSISSILAGIAQNYWILLVARVIEGFGSAIYVTIATIFIALVAKPERRGFLMGIYSGFLLLGSIFGPSFGGIIANIYGINAPFFAYAIVSAIGIIPTLTLPSIKNSENENTVRLRKLYSEAWSILKKPNFLFVLPSIFCFFFIRTGVRNTLVPLFSLNDLSLNEIDIGILLTLAAIATTITMLPVGIISDKIGRRTPLLISLICSAFVTLWIPFTLNLVYISSVMFAYGAMIGLSGPISAYMTDIAPKNKLEIYMGMYRTIGDIGFVLGPLLMGSVADLTNITVLRGGSLITLIGWPPFAVAASIMVLSGLILFKAPDPRPNGIIS